MIWSRIKFDIEFAKCSMYMYNMVTNRNLSVLTLHKHHTKSIKIASNIFHVRKIKPQHSGGLSQKRLMELASTMSKTITKCNQVRDMSDDSSGETSDQMAYFTKEFFIQSNGLILTTLQFIIVKLQIDLFSSLSPS